MFGSRPIFAWGRKLNREICPLCGTNSSQHAIVQEVVYFECRDCDFIFADPELLARVDAGEPLRHYDGEYWGNELASARARSFGSSLARSAEALLYCRIPVEKFIDIGTGPGYLLDALSVYLPSHKHRFHGVEKYPPADHERTKHPNYLCMDLANVTEVFECGVCIEVIEHLTPSMAANLAEAIALTSAPGSLFLFNTGLTDYVRAEDPYYLDPYGRGHITCWSVMAARKIFEPHGFTVHSLPGKTWAFVIERPSLMDLVPMQDRIWTALEANLAILQDPEMGSVMHILGLESARAYTSN